MKMCVLATALFAMAGAAQADLVVNGGFETGDMTGWTVAHAGSFSGVDGGGGTPHTGNHWFAMGATSTTDATDFYQDVPTTPGQQYIASFWGYDESAGFIHVTIGGADIGPASGSLSSTYTQYSLTFTATAATTRLESIGYEPPLYVITDDYSVVAVPAPGSLALLGLGGLFAGRRRR